MYQSFSFIVSCFILALFSLGGIYIHIPYCKQACHYCDFHFSTRLTSLSSMIKAMIGQIKNDVHWFDDTNALPTTLYFGGGTPSLLDEDQFGEIIQAIQSNFNNPSFDEVTVEANPEDINKEKLRVWKDHGVDRVSLGVQTLHDPFLAYANRNHQSSRAIQAIDWLCEEGFNKISADLMFGFPDQNEAQLAHDIKTLTNFPINHLSVYCLTIEPNTVFGRRSSSNRLPVPDDEVLENMFYRVRALLEERGYHGYEISNFAKPGYEAIHNSNYWKGRPYLGIGPSAHSYKNKIRRANTSNNQLYMQQINSTVEWYVSEDLSPAAVFNEQILTGLRRAEGLEVEFTPALFDEKNLRKWMKSAEKLCEEKLLIREKNHLKLTHKGLWQADGVAMRLFV